MEFTNSIQSQLHDQDAQDRTLQVSFSWVKNTITITEPGNDDPIYHGKLNPWTLKTVYRTGSPTVKGIDSESNIIGHASIGLFKPDCETDIRGRPIRLSAAKRLLTIYNYPSLAYATNPGRPAVMTWKSNSCFKAFDFDLLDEDGKLVGRFNPRCLSVRKAATVELFGAKAWDQQAAEEVLITGLTLYICMVYRASSPVPLVGALISRPGKDYKVTEQQAKEEGERYKAANTPDVWDNVIGGATVNDRPSQ
ncbi:hypothetical protein H2198_006383 [Neophaeococcomyces mojaviensis]|uniref:Uncharacterized protein n=1 Tax=Neophaeococcomyces mojaviensis TaxID=3383035 RepID=A0ACC3A300_9EURO|nr:hypothetical protein H2198_006383 [Knufia sp. JES_112]